MQCYHCDVPKGDAGEGLLNTREAARFLRVSEASVRRWSDFGLLPAQRVGRRRDRGLVQRDLVGFLGQASRQTRTASDRPAYVNVGGQRIPLRSHLAPIY